MLEIRAGSQQIELFTGTPYEKGTVLKYFLQFSDNTFAAVYKSGILKSVGDIHRSVTIRTLGGSLVALEPDVKTGGYITCIPTQQQLDQFKQLLSRLETLREHALTGNAISITRLGQKRYETIVPTDDDILHFFRSIKGPSELDALALQLNAHLGAMDIIHPDVGDRDYLAFSFCQGCDGGCVKCSFQHERQLRARSSEEITAQIGFYKNLFSPEERARFDMFAGNHRGLGIDFDLFSEYVGRIRTEAGMSQGNVFAFCNAEDILHLQEQYGRTEMEARMLRLGLHLNIGIESGSPQGLREYGKNLTLPSIRQALVILKNTAIPYSVNILAGVDWENHVLATVQLFRGLYRPGDNKPAVYSSEFMNERGNVDRNLEAAQYKTFRTVLNDCGIYVFRYTFVPFN